MVKIIFLDIDGVLISTRSVLARLDETCTRPDYQIADSIQRVDPVAVGLVNRLCRKADVRIVISSSHRTHFANLHSLRLYIAELGITGEVIGSTPVLNKARGFEIQSWLETWEEETGSNSTVYIIADDIADMLPEQKCNFIKCDPNTAFSAKNYYDACRILGITESNII